MRRLLALPLLLLAMAPVHAEDERGKLPAVISAFDAAARATEAAKQGDKATLKALMERKLPDPWIVADLLCARGEHDVARALATAWTHEATAGLARYVASRRGKADDPAARKALEATTRGIREGRFQAALDAMKDHEGGGGTLVGIRLLFHKGLLFRPMRRLLESSELSLRAAAAAERWGWARMAMRAYDSAGIIHRVLKNPKKAIAYYRRALVHAETLGEPLSIANASRELANVQFEHGAFKEAIALYQRALDLFERLGRERETASVLNNTGRIQSVLGDYGRSLAHHTRALELRVKLGDLARAAGEEINIGVVHSNLAAYAKALEFFERGYQNAVKAGEKQWQFNALNNMASVYWDLGNPARARAYAERALDVVEDGGRAISAAPVLVGLGMIHAKVGDTERAWSYYERGLSQARTLDQPRHVANALGNIARLHLRLREYDRAASRYREALAAAEEFGDRVLVARYAASLGVTAVRMGQRAEGVKRLRRAIREARRLRARPLLSWALPILAEIHLEDDDPGRALYVALEGLRQVERQIGGLGEDEAASVRSLHADLFAVGALAAARADEPAEVVTFLESGRAGSLLEALGGRKAMRWTHLSAELRREEVQAKRAHEVAHAAFQSAVAKGGLAERRAAAKGLDEADARVREVASRIRREAKGQAAGLFYPRAATLEEIQASLDEGQCMVIYGLCMDEALAIVLTSESESLVALGAADDVTAACEALRIAKEDTADDPLGRLRTLLVKPLGLPKKVSEVIVSPEGPLCYVPFGALYDRPVAMSPSGTTHVLLVRDESVAGTQVLALGDPDYGGKARNEDAVYARGRRLVRLPFTRDEANAIGDTVLLGAEANEGRLRNALATKERWRAVHFACHGLVDAKTPTRSSLALSRAGSEDGFLTAREVLRMDMHADLAVLSACETGTGKVVRGEGILGLTRAFMYAGAPRVICSLWKVDDEATKALMVKFYELWNPKQTPFGEGSRLRAADALKQAQAFVRGHDKWSHPYYWAAWVLWGLP